MTAHLLIAPPASGKTEACLKLVIDQLQAEPFLRVWIIVPDRQQAAAFRARLAGAGGALGAQVATFRDLYGEILARAGRSLPLASEISERRLVRAALAEASEQGNLALFGRLANRPGLAAALRQSFRELKSALVTPERLEQTARQASDQALLDLTQVYAGYQRRLQDLDWVDEEGLSWLAFEALQDAPGLLAGLPLVIVDGFDTFNPTQLRTLLALSTGTAELWITLPGQPGMPREAQRRFVKAYQDLTSGLSISVETLPAENRLRGSLAGLEARLFEPQETKLPGGAELALLETSSQREEAREALRWIKARILRDGVPPNECAVLAPELDAYRDGLKTAAYESGLRLHFPSGLPLLKLPAIHTLIDLVRLALAGWPQRPLLELVRSPFLDLSHLGLARADASTLEVTARYAQIVEGMDAWQSALQELAAREPEEAAGPVEEDVEEAPRAPKLPSPEEAGRLLSGLNRLAARITPPGGQRSLRDWMDWLSALLSELAYLSGDSPEERVLSEKLNGLLDSLATSEELARNPPRSVNEFVGEIEGLISTECLPDDELDGVSVTVLTISGARGLRFQAAVLMGLSEGIFPRVERADPLLSESVRTEFGMQPQIGQHQSGLFYQAVTRASGWLLLTRPYLTDSGESWEASPFWNAVLACVQAPVTRIRPDDRRPLAEAVSIGEKLFWAARRAALTGLPLEESCPPGEQARWAALARPQEVLRARLRKQAEGEYNGHLSGLEEALEQRFGGQSVWSVSRLESYTTCPFFFFSSSALQLEELRAPQVSFDIAQRGSILHAALEEVYRTCPDPNDLDVLMTHLPRAAKRVFDRAPAELGFRPSPLWELEQEELLLILEDNLRQLAQNCAEGGWRPLAFERSFGMEGEPTLEIELEGGKVRLRGKIDRVDSNSSGQVRVIDYKSGSSHQSADDLVHGRRLQLPLYALAARDALHLGEPVDGFYWPLSGNTKTIGLRLSRFESETGSGVAAAVDTARQHIQRAVSEIRSGAFSPRPPADGCPAYCPAAAWCWHTVKGR